MSQAERLPTRLRSEPLIDAIFQMQFSGMSAVQVLPGYLYAKLEGDKQIELLPVAGIPPVVRQQDQNLAMQPTHRMLWDQYILSFGDGMFGVACRLPYPGWEAFRSTIISLVSHVIDSKTVSQVSRFSLRYLDLIDGEQPADLNEKLDIDLVLGGIRLDDGPFQLQTMLELGGLTHRVVLTSPAELLVGEAGAHRRGLLMSVDTPFEQSSRASGFVSLLETQLDQVHTANKRTFFTCLTEAAVQAMGPEYDQS